MNTLTCNTCMYTCTHTYIQAHAHACTTHAHTCMHTYTHVHMHIYIHHMHRHTCMRVHMHTHMCTCTYTCIIHIDTLTCIHMPHACNTHTCTCIHTQACTHTQHTSSAHLKPHPLCGPSASHTLMTLFLLSSPHTTPLVLSFSLHHQGLRSPLN